jgi:hypothetical protein
LDPGQPRDEVIAARARLRELKVAARRNRQRQQLLRAGLDRPASIDLTVPCLNQPDVDC